uniref:G-protein coupled receptors family 1 profile domain-containing protein n=1 Tax=Gopherus agassizii TaxID=38772 RepID=A0A452HRW8_9SAUR
MCRRPEAARKGKHSPLVFWGPENRTVCQIYDLPAVIIDGITLLICFLGLVRNKIVLWFLGFCIKRNLFTVYILSLGTTFMIFLYLMRTFSLLPLVTYSTSLYLLTAISTERCLSFLNNSWCQCYHPKHLPHLSAIVCALLWMLFCLLTGLGAFVHFLNSFANCIMMLTPLSVTNFLIFTSIVVLSSLTLFIKVQSSSQRQLEKLYTTILLTVLFFLNFAISLRLWSLLQYFNHSFLHAEICHMLASANSSINPVIYFLVGRSRKEDGETAQGRAQGDGNLNPTQLRIETNVMLF